MGGDIKRFKDIVATMVEIGDSSALISDTDIDAAVESLYALRVQMGLNITQEEKILARNELLANIKVRLEPGVAIVAKGHKEWFVERKDGINFEYWDRFKTYLNQDKGLPLNVISKMDANSDAVVDLLGDPLRETEEQRRGLIIGDVQSGKTINYSGIICKAVDAGYRIVILMTGTTSDLRSQTQMRLDEAFLGIDTSIAAKGGPRVLIGAGKYNPLPSPIAFTSVEKDFSVSAVRQMTTSLSRSENDKPMLFVIKKNVSVLKNLLDWMKSSGQYGDHKIDNSILVIDDEADYASINTKAEGEDHTKTNYLIEEILNIYRFASYVGFTATPYANVFIDPDTTEEMGAEGLFPKDYIYSLNAPEDYIGARNIFPKKSKYHHILRDIEDAEKYYPTKHKKYDDLEVVSGSLKAAIRTFFIANALRDLRGDKTTHRSMMINVTRFIDTQKGLKKAVAEYADELKRSVRMYASLPIETALKDEHLKSLYDSFSDEYSSTEFIWQDIQQHLLESVVDIKVLVAHGGGDNLNYHEHGDGLRAIVVGGIRLSRGLTLEGLIVSYIYRNSMAYDTLMQMGRWFGFRKGYDDICRIWMDHASQNWYEFISGATDELREEVDRMRLRGATPLEFGLKVRDDNDIPLIVTARNKMRTAKSTILRVSLSQKSIETPYIYNDPDKNNNTNLSAVSELIKSVEFTQIKSRLGAYDVEKYKVLKLLRAIKMPPANAEFDPELVASFIDQYVGHEMSNWDIVVLSGDGGEYKLENDLIAYQNVRKVTVKIDTGIIAMNQRRLGSPSDTGFGLSEGQLSEVDDLVVNTGRSIKSRGSTDYLAIKRKPLLMIYFIKPTVNSEGGDIKDFEGVPLLGFAIGIPKLTNAATKYISYKTNKIHQEFGGMEEFEDE